MKVAIVCGSPSSEMLAPFDDPAWQIWVLGNRLNRYEGKRVSRIFEIHDDLSEHGDVRRYVEYLVSQNAPMVVGEGFPASGPNIEIFPFKAARELIEEDDHLTSSPAYMIAYALLQIRELSHMEDHEIGLYGVDMAVDDREYFWQRPCVEFWRGFAKGYGVKVSIPHESSLGKYPYVEGRGSGGKPEFRKVPFTESEFKALAQRHAEKIEGHKDAIRAAEIRIAGHEGARQAYLRMGQAARAVESGIDIKTLAETVDFK